MSIGGSLQGQPPLDPELTSGYLNSAAGAGRVHLARRMAHNPSAVFAVMVLALIAISAIFAPLLAPYSPSHIDPVAILQPPSGSHLLGTDGGGRDVLSQLLYASRLSIAAPLLALAVAMVLGVSTGLVAGYYGGFLDSTMSWISSLLMAIPGIIVLLAARAALGSSVWIAMTVFGVLLSPAFYRLVYGTVAAVKHELYVDAARVAGLGDARIIGRHVLRAVRGPIIIQAAMVTAIAIAIEAALDFIGLGDPTSLTWGNMLNSAFTTLYSDKLLIVWPVAAIALTSIALALLANATRDALVESVPKPSRRTRARAHARPLPVVSAPVEAAVLHEAPVTAATTGNPAGTGAGATPLLEVSGLQIGYPTQGGELQLVVQDVSLTVTRGEVHGLIGESGSGKTQTAFAILGVLPEGGRTVSGEIRFDGRELVAGGEAEFAQVRGRRIAYIPQEPMSNLDPSFTVGSQLVEPLRVCLGVSRKQATETALELLARVGISDPRRTFRAYPHEISGGMAQRVLIAGAVSCSPDLLIADEPTTALDVTVQAEVLDLLRELQREARMGMILVTHNFGVVADICDRVSVMQNGRIVEAGSVRSVFADPRHAYTRALFDAIVGKDEPDITLEDLQAVETVDAAGIHGVKS